MRMPSIIQHQINRAADRRRGPHQLPPVSGLITSSEINTLAAKPVLTEQDDFTFANPPAALQERFVGVTFERAYHEAALFLNYVFAGIDQLELQAGMNVLDFGCGWGRMLRLLRFSGKFQNADLHGCDPDQSVMDYCRRSIPGTWLSRSDTMPPSSYRDALFGVVYSYSVFSHLSPECHLAWADEIARITRPGGIVCVTTRPRDHILTCQELRSRDQASLTAHQQALAASFNEAGCESRYDAGEMLFTPAKKLGPLYGEAVVPRQFFETKWGALGLDMIDWQPADGWQVQNYALFRRTAKAFQMSHSESK